MTNKEAINNINFVKDYYKDLDDCTINQLRNLTLNLLSIDMKALDKAIVSLEAWNKVKGDLIFFYNIYDSYDNKKLTKDKLFVVNLSKKHYKHALDIINKHLEEIEE